jgi:carbon monoxide dehydrogenase subunit G
MHLSFRIKKSKDEVFNFLTDMQKFVTVHPVITQIDKIDQGKYLMHETLKIGFIPYSFTYPATIVKDSQQNLVKMTAVVMKLAKIEMQFDLKADGEYTMIEENIHFESFLPIQFIMKSVFKQQHPILFKNIEKTAS